MELARMVRLGRVTSFGRFGARVEPIALIGPRTKGVDALLHTIPRVQCG